MSNRLATMLLPMGLICFVSTVAIAEVAKTPVPATVATPSKGAKPRVGAPPNAGFIALQKRESGKAATYFQAADAAQPDDAFTELNLGAAYQQQGRMDMAEPLYRQAMTHGNGLMPTEPTLPWAKGLTVEQIACRNLEMGLAAAAASSAKRCQTVITVGIAHAPGTVSSEFNTYFPVNGDKLTAAGQASVLAAVKSVMSDPEARVVVTGRSSKRGTAAYNADLSERRAKTVRDAMLVAGLAPSRIVTVWEGEENSPVAQSQIEVQPGNRVVETKVITPSSSTAAAQPKN